MTNEYCAGFFDGEGCVGIRANKTGCTFLCVTINNTNREVLELFLKQFGGLFYNYRKATDKWKEAYMWRIHGIGAKKFLDLIYPHVIVKKQQVKLALEYFEFSQKPKEERCTKRKIENSNLIHFERTQETKQIEKDFVNEMHKLNKKGPPLEQCPT